MAVIRNDEILKSWVQALKGNTTIIALLDDPDEIRQADWKGTNFTYPNIRVDVFSNNPALQESDKCLADINMSIYVYSEEASSYEANRIAGIIADEYNKKSLNSQGLFFTRCRVDAIVPAIAQDERTWRSQTNITTTVRRS
jgi:hypothetical protein